jgi:hypothetical protein
MAARFRRTSSMISFFIFLFSKKFSRGANDRNVISFPIHNVADLPDDFRVRKMPTIPCQKIVHSMPCGNSYMDGIRRRFLGNQPVLKEFLRKTDRRFINREFFQSTERLKPPTGSLDISMTCLLHNSLRDKQSIHRPALLPPFARDGLLTGCDQIARGASREVARDCCFKINGGFFAHGLRWRGGRMHSRRLRSASARMRAREIWESTVEICTAHHRRTSPFLRIITSSS